MVDQIRNIGGAAATSATSGVTPTRGADATGVSSSRIGGASFDEKFQFPPQLEREIALKYGNSVVVQESLKIMFRKLIYSILKYKIIIRPSPMRQRGNSIIEARLRQDITGKKRPVIEAPIPGTTEELDIMQTEIKRMSVKELIEEFLDKVIPCLNDASILRLIVVLAHEFGHYLSFLMGYHTKQLHEALRIFASGRINSYYVDQFLYLVFNEEISAWNLAEKTLRNNCGFDYMDVFNAVREQSLKSYIQALSLGSADKLATYYRLGENYVNLNRALMGK